jgi:excisionase family DNA binding protein
LAGTCCLGIVPAEGDSGARASELVDKVSLCQRCKRIRICRWLLTPREVASVLRLDVSTVYRMIERGTIAGVQFGGSRHTVRIPTAEVERLTAPPKPAAGGATSSIAGSPQSVKTKTIT